MSHEPHSGDCPRIWVIGSANMDLVVRTTRFPRPGETLLGGPFSAFPGGKGANQAVAAAKLGANVCFVGSVGKDSFGNQLLIGLREHGVDTTRVRRNGGTPTGVAAILVNEAGSNEIVVAPGANMDLSAHDVEETLIECGGDPVLVQLEIPIEAVEAACKAQTLFLDPAPARPLPSAVLEGVFLLTPNEVETEVLTGIVPSDPASCRLAASALLDRGVRNVVITLGDRGCFFLSPHDELIVPSRPVRAYDTVAAGDVFNASLAWSYAECDDWTRSLKVACSAAALSTTKAGAQASMPTLSELKLFAPDLF